MTLVDLDGRGWAPTWIAWYVGADDGKVPCTWPLYDWDEEAGQRVRMPFYSAVRMGQGRIAPRIMHRPSKGGQWEPVPQHPRWGAFQTEGMIAGPATRTIIIDLDHAEHAPADAVQWCAEHHQGVSDDGTRTHTLVIVPDALVPLWPRQGPCTYGRDNWGRELSWGDVKSAGFTYLTGWNAERTYSLVRGRPYVVADEPMMAMLLGWRGGQLHTGKARRRKPGLPDGNRALSLADYGNGWTDPDGTYPEWLAELVLEDWQEGDRHYSLMRRTGWVLGGGEAGLPGMRSLLGDLADRYDSETGRGGGQVLDAAGDTEPVNTDVVTAYADYHRFTDWLDGLPGDGDWRRRAAAQAAREAAFKEKWAEASRTTQAVRSPEHLAALLRAAGLEDK